MGFAREPVIPAMLGLLFTLAGGACQQTFHQDPYADGERSSGPGYAAWGSDDLQCETSRDCLPSEECTNGACIIRRCASGPYNSIAPLGPSHYFLHDRELLLATDRVRAFEPTGASEIRRDATSPERRSGDGDELLFPWRVINKLLDIAGGNVIGDRPERGLAVVEGEKKLFVQGRDPLTLPFAPIAIAAGDVDHDGLDEVVGLGKGGRVVLCEVDEEFCEEKKIITSLGEIEALDVAVGDIDADNYDEPVFLYREGDMTKMVAWNPDFREHHQDEFIPIPNERAYFAVAVGDVDGDNHAEVLALGDGKLADAWIEWQVPALSRNGVDVVPDRIDLIRVAPRYEPVTDGTRLGLLTAQDERGNESRAQRLPHVNTTTGSHIFGNVTVDASALDIAVSDLDMDRAAEVILLRENGIYDIYRATGVGRLAATADFGVQIPEMAGAHKISVADVDGDSAKARLIDPVPELVAGNMIPIMQVHWPPYSRTYSATTPYVYVGHTHGTGHHRLDSVGLYAQTEVGLKADAEGFGIGVSEGIRDEIRTYHRVSYDQFVGSREVITPEVELHGHDYSVVLLANSCYHVYRYRLWDPKRKLGERVGEEMVIALPVEGYITSWSSKRYNAFAKLVGDLPIVGDTFEIGNLDAYPNTPMEPDGTPILPSQEVFDHTPRFLASDAARNGWWLSSKEYDVRETQRHLRIETGASLSVPFVKWLGARGVDSAIGLGASMSQEVVFGGAIPPIGDDPKTPEDEFRTHNYSFTPLVYRKYYGKDSYFVLSYMVGQ
jgi:hypothetical protein